MSTSLGSLRQHNPNHWVLWNVADYVVNFQNQADKGITRLEVKRTAACTSPVNVGAAFDYEANQGGGIASVSVGFGFFSVSYSGSGLHGHWGTDAIWGWIYPA